MELPILNFPEQYNFKIKKQDSTSYIFDEVRKKWLILTPEEWVRQHVIKFIKLEKKISDSAILIEKKIEINRQYKRLDILILKKATPWILVECKAPEVKLTKETFEQVARYNTLIKAENILITNGINHISFKYDLLVNEYVVNNLLNL